MPQKDESKKEFELRWLYQQGWVSSRNFRDGQKFKVDGKEEGKMYLTHYKAQEGSIWKKVKAGITEKSGNTGAETLEHGNWWDRHVTYTKTHDDDGSWNTVLTTSRETSDTKSSDYSKSETSSTETSVDTSYGGDYYTDDDGFNDGFGSFAQTNSTHYEFAQIDNEITSNGTSMNSTGLFQKHR